MNKDYLNADLALTHEELLDEIAILREKLKSAESREEIEKERLRLISKDLKLGFWEWDEVENRATRYSEEFASIFGLCLDQLNVQYRMLEDFSKCVHPDDLEEFNQKLAISGSTNLRTGEGFSYEFRIIRPDGEVRHVKETEYLVPNSRGEIISSYGTLQDITDFRLAHKALKQSEESYSSLFINLPLGIQEEDYSPIKAAVDKLLSEGVVDLKAFFLQNSNVLHDLVREIRCTKVNQAMLNLHGADSTQEFIEEEEDTDKWWDEDWAEFYADEISTFARDSANYHDAERVDTRIDGTPIETRSIASIVQGYEKSWGRILTIHEDITDRKNDEAALVEAKTTAEKASQAKSQFLSSMSHELRTPLNAILGFSQLFEYDKNISEHHRSNALEINRAGKHLMSLIDEVLDLSRIESGNLSLLMESVSLQDIIGESLTWVAEMANSRDINIQFDSVAFTGVLVSADTLRLKQVFLNLLTNAIKYNRQGGHVSVICDRNQKGIINIGIQDTGSGIPESQLDDLFQPFNRLGAELGSVEGTGIGLVITRQLVELMEGSIWVESRSGQGSTFWIALSEIESIVVMPEQSEAHGSGDLISVISTRPSILVAEDNLINQALMKAQLDVIGYEADYAVNGVEALKLWRKTNYDMLLTDIRMPEMDGYELTRNIRQNDEESGARSSIIAISANALETDTQRCFEVGVDEVIAKPVELEQLREVLEEWNPKKQTVDIDVSEIGFGDSHSNQARTDSKPIANAIELMVLEQSVGANVEVHHRLLKVFIDVLPTAVTDIRNAVSWRNPHKLFEAAHKLKSSSRSVGAVVLSDVCQLLETAGRDDQWSDIEALLFELNSIKKQTITFVENFCGQLVIVKSRVEPDQIPQVPASALSVLVVDDDYIIHRVTTVILNDLGISNVQSALSGPQALDIIKQNAESFDVVICDLNMPGMDGIELMRHLAKLNFRGAIIITSGEDVRILRTVEKLAIEHELQVLGVLQKPVMPAKIMEMLELLDQAKTEGTMVLGAGVTAEDLKQAIHKDELVTYFQPKVDLKTSRVVGMEVLVRWEHPQKGMIMPGSFIPVAEENNLISELTRVVCTRAMAQAAILQRQGFDLNIAINISVDTLNNLDWPDEMAEQIECAGISASSITFEITESRLMEHISVALDILSRLSLKRFNLSIDDFGTGYSSMEQLQRIPFTELKIDRAFVSGAAEDDSALAILESSVLLAKKLNMKIVAEGVETQQEWDLMLALGCDQVQGYFVSRPMPFDQMVDWLVRWQSDH